MLGVHKYGRNSTRVKRDYDLSEQAIKRGNVCFLKIEPEKVKAQEGEGPNWPSNLIVHVLRGITNRHNAKITV